MNNADLTRQADVVVGEASVALLRSRDHISADGLARQLRAMNGGETNPERRAAIALALGELLSEFIK